MYDNFKLSARINEKPAFIFDNLFGFKEVLILDVSVTLFTPHPREGNQLRPPWRSG